MEGPVSGGSVGQSGVSRKVTGVGKKTLERAALKCFGWPRSPGRAGRGPRPSAQRQLPGKVRF